MKRAFDGLRSHILAAVLLLVLLPFLLYNLGGWGVIETSEARYAEISREMLLSGDWLHPRLLGIQHFHKPPITYIISAAGMGLFGVNEFGARFFLQLSLLVQASLVYLIALELFGSRKMAFTALVVYVTMPAVLISARNLTTDSFLTTFELLAIWCWMKYKPAKRPAWLYLFYLALSLAFLTKGPVGLIFPVLVAIGCRPRLSAGKPSFSHHLIALVLFLVLSGSWYVYLMWQDRQFVDYFFLNHLVKRYASPETFGRSEPWWFYLAVIPALTLPWFAQLLLHLKKLRQLPRDLKLLFLMWLVLPLLFFSLSSSKLILYILPMLAGITLLISWLFFQLTSKDFKVSALVTFAYLGIVGFALVLLPFLPLNLTVPMPMVVFAALVLVVLYLIWRFMEQGIQQLVTAVLVFTLFLLPYSTHLLGANAVRLNPSTALGNLIREKGLQNRTIIVYDRLLPSLAFELNKDIVYVRDQHESLNREMQFEKNDEWRNHLLLVQERQDSIRLQQMLNSQAVLISKRELPVNRSWLRQQLVNNSQVGDWVVYY